MAREYTYITFTFVLNDASDLFLDWDWYKRQGAKSSHCRCQALVPRMKNSTAKSTQTKVLQKKKDIEELSIVCGVFKRRKSKNSNGKCMPGGPKEKMSFAHASRAQKETKRAQSIIKTHGSFCFSCFQMQRQYSTSWDFGLNISSVFSSNSRIPLPC